MSRVSDERLAGFLAVNGHAQFTEIEIAYDLRDARREIKRLREAICEALAGATIQAEVNAGAGQEHYDRDALLRSFNWPMNLRAALKATDEPR
jgi:hypothetical protein